MGTSSFDLHTTGEGREGGLRRRLLDTAAEAAEARGLSSSVRIAGAVDTVVPARAGAHGVAVVREAAGNAVWHAGPSTVTLTVVDDLLIEVVDDGVGITAGAVRSGSLNLENRVPQRGGDLVVQWAAGRRMPEPAGTAALREQQSSRNPGRSSTRSFVTIALLSSTACSS